VQNTKLRRFLPILQNYVQNKDKSLKIFSIAKFLKETFYKTLRCKVWCISTILFEFCQILHKNLMKLFKKILQTASFVKFVL